MYRNPEPTLDYAAYDNDMPFDNGHEREDDAELLEFLEWLRETRTKENLP